MIDVETLKSRLFYNPDTGLLAWKTSAGGVNVGSIAGHMHKSGYWRVPLNRRKYPAHRIAWAMSYGEWPEKQIDHIDGNKSNNAISNLRLATPSMNQLYNNNARRGNSSGFLGVRVMGRKFATQIKVNGVVNWLGVFDTAEEAHRAYLNAKQYALLRAHNITKD